MDSSKKLYIALALLAVLGGGLYLQNKKQKEEARSYSFEAKVAELPNVTIDEAARSAIDAIEITRAQDAPKDEAGDSEETAEPADPSKREVIGLKKTGEETWSLTQPVTYTANASNVKSLLDNLGKLKIGEQISSSSADYEKWGLGDDKALRAVFKRGEEVVLDLYVGETGSRGQMVRLGGRDGVYALKGYSQYLYNRDSAGWRDKTILKFEDADVVEVSITNANGEFSFQKSGETWTGRHKVGAAAAKDISDFKASKVEDLIRAYKALNASNFGDGKQLSEVGLENPAATLTLKLKDESAKYVIQVGDASEGSSRWIKTNTSEQIFSVSSWTADWATADATKFQDKKTEETGGGVDEAALDPHAGHGH